MPVTQTHPNLILYNARVLTQDAEMPQAQAVAIRGAHIAAVGDDQRIRALAGAETRQIDCVGKTLLPGLCDAHIHFGPYSLYLARLPLARTTSKAEMLAMLAERAATTPAGTWIVAQGWNESKWGESEFPTAQELDSATGLDVPALLYRSDMHCALANSAALALAGITEATQDPPMGVIDRDAQGKPTGVLKEYAMRLVDDYIPEPTPEERVGALRQGMAALHKLGITAIHDQRLGGGEGGEMLGAFQELRAAGELKLRTNCNISAHYLPEVRTLGLHSGFGDDTLRLGHIKLFSDGSLGSRTAWMLEPFVRQGTDTTDNYGVVVTEPAQIASVVREAVAAGFPISIHAIGDRANREVLDVLEEAASTGAARRVPHRIEHVQMLHADDWARLAALNVTASVQPIHALDDMDTADLLLGERAAEAYAFRSLLDAGTRLAFGSDAPVADPNPWIGIHGAVVRQRPERADTPPWHPEQCIGLEDALYAYTMGAAVAAGWQDAIGSITPGKRADLVLVDRDLTAQTRFADAQAVLTIFDGEVVFGDLWK